MAKSSKQLFAPRAIASDARKDADFSSDSLNLERRSHR